jgi:hypothetical protein
MYEIKKIKMEDGNLAVPARERILYAVKEGIKYTIKETFEELAGGRFVKCSVILSIYENALILERPGTSVQLMDRINYNFAYETAETKAIGRAFAAHGIGIEENYASADELQDVKLPMIQNEEAAKKGEEAVAAVEKILEPVGKKDKIPPRKLYKSEPLRPEVEGESVWTKPVDKPISGPGTLKLPSEQRQERAVQTEPEVQPEPESVVQPEPETELKPEPDSIVAPPVVKPTTLAVESNPYKIIVPDLPEKANASGLISRPFTDYVKIFRVILDGGDATLLEKTANNLIVDIKTGDGSLGDQYTNLKTLILQAPTGVVNYFLSEYYKLKNS